MSLPSVLTLLGYVNVALVLCTYSMRSQLRLRQFAIASNLVCIAFFFGTQIYPSLLLNAVLLPINVLYLREILRTRNAIQKALGQSELSLEWLTPFMDRRRLQAGERLFSRNDLADAMYFVVSGTLALQESGIELRGGALLGEIGIFSPSHRRTQSAVARTEVELLAISEIELLALYRRNPTFGIFLIRLITERLVGAVETAAAKRAEASAEATPPAVAVSEGSTARGASVP